jgi:hypothetical protein
MLPDKDDIKLQNALAPTTYGPYNVTLKQKMVMPAALRRRIDSN